MVQCFWVIIMAKATKLSSGNWRCKAYFTDENGKYTSKSFTRETKREAEAIAAAWLIEMEHDQKPENKTIGELVDRYIDNLSNLHSPSTILGYRKKRNAAFKEIMEVRAGHLTQQKYQAAVNNYAKGRKAKTVIEAHNLMRMVFSENHIKIDMKNIQLPQKTKTEIQVPETEDVKTLIDLCKGTSVYLPVLLAALMGLRKSEIFALTWGDVDIEDGTLSVNKAIVQNEYKEYVIKETKTVTSNRVLHMPQAVIDALPLRKDDNERLLEMPYAVFTNRYRRVMKKMPNKYTFHALRHYYASAMLLQGVPTKYAIERMGHSTDNMLKQVYQHTFPNKQAEFDTTMENFFKDSGIG